MHKLDKIELREKELWTWNNTQNRAQEFRKALSQLKWCQEGRNDGSETKQKSKYNTSIQKHVLA